MDFEAERQRKVWLIKTHHITPNHRKALCNQIVSSSGRARDTKVFVTITVSRLVLVRIIRLGIEMAVVIVALIVVSIVVVAVVLVGTDSSTYQVVAAEAIVAASPVPTR